MYLDKRIENYFYNTVHLIGKGSYGSVYRGVNKNTQTGVAIKIVKKTNLERESYSQKALINEMTILKKLHSKNIVRLFDVCESQSNYCLISELCQQGDLKKILNEQQLQEQEAIKILHDILSGYQILLKNDIPANILNSNGIFKLGDFGIATQLSKEKMLNSLVGTPLYMSPQVQQKSNYTNKCNIWSIGILFYECLYGETPWFHETSTKLLKSIYEQPLEFPIQPLVSDVSKQFIKNCLEINEKDRIDWIDIYNQSIFRLNLFKKIIRNSQQIITKIRNIIKIRNFNINQLIQNISMPKKLKINDLNLLLQSIDLVFDKLNHYDTDTIPFEQYKHKFIVFLLNFQLNKINPELIICWMIQLFEQGQIQSQLLKYVKRNQLKQIRTSIVNIDAQISKDDITLLYRKIKEENQGSVKRNPSKKCFKKNQNYMILMMIFQFTQCIFLFKDLVKNCNLVTILKGFS